MSIVTNLAKFSIFDLTKSKKLILTMFKKFDLPKTNFTKVNFSENDFLTLKTKKSFYQNTNFLFF